MVSTRTRSSVSSATGASVPSAFSSRWRASQFVKARSAPPPAAEKARATSTSLSRFAAAWSPAGQRERRVDHPRLLERQPHELAKRQRALGAMQAAQHERALRAISGGSAPFQSGRRSKRCPACFHRSSSRSEHPKASERSAATAAISSPGIVDRLEQRDRVADLLTGVEAAARLDPVSDAGGLQRRLQRARAACARASGSRSRPTEPARTSLRRRRGPATLRRARPAPGCPRSAAPPRLALPRALRRLVSRRARRRPTVGRARRRATSRARRAGRCRPARRRSRRARGRRRR